jgi:hypothetical protein
MKKIIIALVTAIAFVSVGVAAPSSALAPTDRANDNLFIKILRSESPTFKYSNRKTLIKTAKSTCKFLRNGYGMITAIETMEDSGFDYDESLSFVVGAVIFYCPEQEGNY